MKTGNSHDNKDQQIQSTGWLLKEGCRCSQAVLGAFCEKLGMDKKVAMKISTGFAGGISRQGGLCGAVTGAIMVLGLKFGQAKAEDIGAKELTYYVVQEFTDQFKSRNGSINCTDLMSCDLSTPEGSKYFRDEKLNEKVCKRLVEDAEEILKELLDTYNDMAPV